MKALSIAALVIGMAVGQAAAQMKCGDRNELLKILSEKYKESLAGIGLSNNGKALFEVFTSDTGTWTIVMTTTTGRACVMAAGKYWDRIERPKGQPT